MYIKVIVHKSQLIVSINFENIYPWTYTLKFNISIDEEKIAQILCNLFNWTHDLLKCITSSDVNIWQQEFYIYIYISNEDVKLYQFIEVLM